MMIQEDSLYLKHVSFNNIAPTLIDDEIRRIKKLKYPVDFSNKYMHIPPQYNKSYNKPQSSNESSKADSLKDDTDSDYGYNSNTNDRVKDMYSSFFDTSRNHSLDGRSNHGSNTDLAGKGWNSYRRSPKLPSPPDKPSIIYREKNKDEPNSDQDIDISDMDDYESKQLSTVTEENTKSNSGSKRGFTQTAFLNLNEVEDRIEKNASGAPHLLPKDSKASSRRKSFAAMTDEELSALEDAYTSLGRASKKNSLDKFDFNEQSSFFIGDIPKKSSMSSLKKITDPFAAIYPSRPCLNYNAVSITRMHKDFLELINRKSSAIEQEHYELPDFVNRVMAKRVIMCYISGRKYTWSSVDWFVENQIQDGDHLVIVSYIPFTDKDGPKTSRYTSLSPPPTTSTIRSNSSQRIDDISRSPSLPESQISSKNYSNMNILESVNEMALAKATEILNYYLSKLKGKNVKVTVEIIKAHDKRSAILSAAEVYKPDWQIITTVSANLQIKFKNGHVKFPFFMMKYFDSPTCIIPYEFMDPNLVDNIDKNENEKVYTKPCCGSNREKWLNEVIKKTLVNPFDTQNDDTKSFNSDLIDEDDIVAPISDYCPLSPKQQNKLDLFEKIGYVRPTPIRQESLTNISPNDSNKSPLYLSRASSRSSRIRFNDDDGVYRVKSLIEAVSSNASTKGESIKVKKTKSYNPKTSSSKNSQHSKHHNKHVAKKQSTDKLQSEHSVKKSVNSSGIEKASGKKKQPLKQVVKQPVKQTVEQTAKHPNKGSVKQLNKIPAEQTKPSPANQSVKQPARQPPKQSVSQPAPKPEKPNITKTSSKSKNTTTMNGTKEKIIDKHVEDKTNLYSSTDKAEPNKQIKTAVIAPKKKSKFGFIKKLFG